MKVPLLAIALSFAQAIPAAADSTCKLVVIAYYNGVSRPLGDIYHERHEAKFWGPDWSPEAIKINGALDEAFPMKEVALGADPCKKTVWLYPVIKNGGKDWVKIGKINKEQESKLFRSNEPFLVRLLHNDLLKEGAFHLLIHLLGW